MRALAPQLAVVIGYVVAALAFSWPLPLHLGTHFTGDPGGDTGVYVWNQWVFHQELVAGHNPLRTEQILAMTSPAVDLTQHNYTAFLNVLALPLISWFGVVASFNVVFLIVCVLNALTMYGLPQGHRGQSMGGVARRPCVRLVAGDDRENHRALQPRGRGGAAGVSVVPRQCRTNAIDAGCGARGHLHGVGGRVRRVFRHLLPDHRHALCRRIVAAGDAKHQSDAARVGVDIDILIVCFGGLIAGLVLGRGGEFTLLGVPIHARTLYTPVLVLTVLVIARTVTWWRPHFEMPAFGPLPVKAILIAGLACAGPLAPVLYGLTERVADGQFVNPKIFWRSSPRGVDLLSFITPNPLHPMARWFAEDPLVLRPTVFVDTPRR